MWSRCCGFGPILLALAVLAAAPATSQAAKLGFRNETIITLVVQGATIEKDRVRAGRSLLIPARNKAVDPMVPPGQRLIRIYNANTNQLLFRDIILVEDKDIFFSIKFDVPLDPITGRPMSPPRIRMMPIEP